MLDIIDLSLIIITCLNSCLNIEISLLYSRLRTMRAKVGPFSAVQSSVRFQSSFSWQWFATNITHTRFLFLMDSIDMNLKIRISFKPKKINKIYILLGIHFVMHSYSQHNISLSYCVYSITGMRRDLFSTVK